jgi:ABC-2 type transport system permease protein
MSVLAITDHPARRLFAAELRKLVNTRASMLFAAGLLVILTLMSIALVTTGGAEHLSFQNMWGMLNLPMSYLLPILAIMLVTSEWTQRTTLVTFALEPRRERVIAAKLATGVAMTVAVLFVTAVLAALATVAAVSVRNGTPGWRLDGGIVRNLLLLQFARIVEGFAFAVVIRRTAVAIVAFLAVPTAWTLLGSLVPWAGEHLRPWIDVTSAQRPFQNGEAPFESAHPLTATNWAHLTVSLAVWVAVPLVLGVRHLRSAELN